ncbi:DUF4397 domain-containing protein [Sphingobacterium spiritivorum]|uniref:DUF4397 domain-containing protein n=1 Tax=Sphingobacterium spiritivorum TaxID=258 RepID=UPI003DA38EB3
MNSVKFLLGSFLLCLLLFTSCSLDNDDYGYGELSGTGAVNAVPLAIKLDIGLDQNKLNLSNESFDFGDYLPYRNAFPGNRLVRVFDRDSIGKAALVSKQVAFAPGKIYSLFVVGDTKLDVVSYEDKADVPAKGTANVRFINLSPDAPALNLGSEGADTLLVKNKSFKEASAYLTLQTGKKYKLFITSNVNRELVSFEFEPKDQSIYTIWAKGLINATPANEKFKFGYKIIQHLE